MGKKKGSRNFEPGQRASAPRSNLNARILTNIAIA
jgi:hypothetical protein